MAAAVPARGLEQRIQALCEAIGDVEPMAPDVDYALDPMIRREASEVQKGDTFESKKARLRELLLKTAVPAGEAT